MRLTSFTHPGLVPGVTCLVTPLYKNRTSRCSNHDLNLFNFPATTPPVAPFVVAISGWVNNSAPHPRISSFPITDSNWTCEDLWKWKGLERLGKAGKRVMKASKLGKAGKEVFQVKVGYWAWVWWYERRNIEKSMMMIKKRGGHRCFYACRSGNNDCRGCLATMVAEAA